MNIRRMVAESDADDVDDAYYSTACEWLAKIQGCKSENDKDCIRS